MNFTRRDLLRLGAGAAALWTSGAPTALLGAGESTKKIPFALQLYSLRSIAGKDVPGTLAAVAQMGYQGVEFAGYYDRKAPELRKMLDQSGLKCCGTHTALETLTGAALKGTVEFNQTLGNKNLIIPWLPPSITTSLAALIDAAKLLTELADKVQDFGMRVGYHAHAHDFKPVADRVPWEVLFTNAGPGVIMQMDVGNCLDGGGDPVAELKKFPRRSVTIHLKEHGGPEGAVIGQGDVPWKEIFQVCETTGGTEWYIVEQESYRGSPLESVKLCLENLHKMGK
jgi:sugar phosphate isomerase/epimerase